MSERDEFYRRFSRSYDKLHQSEKQDDLVERVAIAIDNAICDGDQSSVAMELTPEEIKVLSRAAIAVVLEEAAKVAENASFHFTQTTPSTVEVVDVRHTIAAAIRAMIQKEEV